MHAAARQGWSSTLALFVPLLLAAPHLPAQTALPKPARIVSAIDDSHLVTLRGNTHPATVTGEDLGAVSPAMPLNRMLLVLQRGPALQAALDAFMAGQYDPKSPDYHHWLSPQQYGELYGPADADIAQITAWLRAQGFAVAKVANSRMVIEFSGTAAQAQAAFHAQIHRYVVNGETHFANSSDPQIPEALAPVVAGVTGLSDFDAISRKTKNVPLERGSSGRMEPVQPQSSVVLPRYTNNAGTPYYLAPGDFDIIYNTTPLLNAGIDGTGVTIAIVARSNIRQSDVSAYRAMFGLPDDPFTVVLDGPDPGIVPGDQDENTLDVEMAAMAAPGAKIALVLSSDINLSALYIVDNQLAPVMSTSYGNCELFNGTTRNAFFNTIWQQASAEGISSFVAAGDDGAADCESSTATYNVATTGLQVDGFSATPWNTSVGGTDFNDGANPATYWSNTNSATGTSALSYIPESPWNSSCANPFVYAQNGGTDPQTYCNSEYAQGAQVPAAAAEIVVVGGGGGSSHCTAPTGTTPDTCTGGYAKPTWQTGPGVPADGKRDAPDVSLMAASGDTGNAIALYENGGLNGFGGTSASSPMMAGLMALVVQKQGMAQGLANPVFYKLAAAQNTANCNSSTVTAGNACYFYDVTTGNNIEPCANNSPNCTNGSQIGILTGYSSTVGYDTASGLGSVNAANLVNGWSTQAPPTAVTVSLAPTTLPAPSQNTQYYQQITAGGGTPPYAYLVSSGTLPVGVTLTPGGILSGTPTTQAAYSFTIVACDSATVNGPNCGSQAYSVTVGAPTVVVGSTITWSPGPTVSYNGLPIGAGVLNAQSTTLGTISYQYAAFSGTGLNAASGIPGTATASTTLVPGQYQITATNSTDNTTLTINYTVLPQHEWIVNAAGNLTALNAAGTADPTPITNVTGGGLGVAIDSQGTAWSANTNGTSVSTFSNYGYNFQTGPTGGGLSAAAAVAIDGAGSLWVANGNGSVSQFTHLSVALSPTGGYTGGGLSGPTGILIDQSGSVWVSNGGNNTTTEILGAATPVAPLAQAVTDNTVGVKP